MPNEVSSREHLRKLILDELAGDGEVAPVDMTRGMYSSGEGFLTKWHTFLGKHCSSTGMLDICGTSTTGDDGTVEIRLEDFVCTSQKPPGAGEGYEYLAPPVSFVATPRADSPVYLTFMVSVIDEDPGFDDPLDMRIRIKVLAWNIAGESASKVKFAWRCCVQLISVPFT